MRTVNHQFFFENDISIDRRHSTNINPFQVLSAPSILGPETLLTNEGTNRFSVGPESGFIHCPTKRKKEAHLAQLAIAIYRCLMTSALQQQVYEGSHKL